MQVNIAELVETAGFESEEFYPGKKLVKKYQLSGQYKSHCVVMNWFDPAKVHVELKAGLTGKDLEPQDLKNYPVSFQAPTYLDIRIGDEINENVDENEDEDDDEEVTGKSGGGGGKKPAKKELDEDNLALDAFGKVTEGVIPEGGKIEKFVIMGKEIAQEAFASAFENLKEQLSQTKVMAMDLMKGVTNLITRATPGGGLEAKGDEAINYMYDLEKNGPMFGAAPS